RPPSSSPFPYTTLFRSCVRVARTHGRPFTARGAGTGLAGGAVPLEDPVMIVTTKMNRILSIDTKERVAWVEPGVINLDLTRVLRSEEHTSELQSRSDLV